MPFPLPLETLVGKPLMYLLFAVIGFGFGFVLEISGFGNSKKLAAQFYFKEMTVLKVEPLTQMGTPTEIIKLFGGREKYLFAVNEFKRELYRMAA